MVTVKLCESCYDMSIEEKQRRYITGDDWEEIYQRRVLEKQLQCPTSAHAENARKRECRQIRQVSRLVVLREQLDAKLLRQSHVDDSSRSSGMRDGVGEDKTAAASDADKIAAAYSHCTCHCQIEAHERATRFHDEVTSSSSATSQMLEQQQEESKDEDTADASSIERSNKRNHFLAFATAALLHRHSNAITASIQANKKAALIAATAWMLYLL